VGPVRHVSGTQSRAYSCRLTGGCGARRPAENRLLELKQIFDFVQPGLLGDDEAFKDEISDVVRIGTRSVATPPEVAVAQARCQILYDLIGPYFLRRTSGGKAKIKAKSELVLWTELAEAQRALYDRVEGSVAQEPKGRRFKRNHELFSVIAGSHPDCGPRMKLGKMRVLRRLIKQFVVKEDQRLGVFFKYKCLLRRTEALLARRGIASVAIHGGTNPKARQDAINAMNDPESPVRVLLATTRSCGHGINLLRTSKLVVLEPSFNASVDDQAAVRASHPPTHPRRANVPRRHEPRGQVRSTRFKSSAY